MIYKYMLLLIAKVLKLNIFVKLLISEKDVKMLLILDVKNEESRR